LVRALRRALGDGLYERSPVTSIRDGEVVTAGGRVRARDVVVATNAWTTHWRTRFTPFGSFVVLTEPVPELLEDIGWTGGEAIADSRMFLHYFRTTEDGRVLMGSGSGPLRRRVDDHLFLDEPTVRRAERGLRRLIGEARVERAWGGPIDVSSDQLPFFFTS